MYQKCMSSMNYDLLLIMNNLLLLKWETKNIRIDVIHMP